MDASAPAQVGQGTSLVGGAPTTSPWAGVTTAMSFWLADGSVMSWSIVLLSRASIVSHLQIPLHSSASAGPTWCAAGRRRHWGTKHIGRQRSAFLRSPYPTWAGGLIDRCFRHEAWHVHQLASAKK